MALRVTTEARLTQLVRQAVAAEGLDKDGCDGSEDVVEGSPEGEDHILNASEHLASLSGSKLVVPAASTPSPPPLSSPYPMPNVNPPTALDQICPSKGNSSHRRRRRDRKRQKQEAGTALPEPKRREIISAGNASAIQTALLVDTLPAAGGGYEGLPLPPLTKNGTKSSTSAGVKRKRGNAAPPKSLAQSMEGYRVVEWDGKFTHFQKNQL